jgi:molecular chaperone GrpE (heat shock protein)
VSEQHEQPADEIVLRLDKVTGQLAEFNRRAAHRELVIDRLHEENQRLHAGIGRELLEPVIADLIRLHDQLGREATRRGEAGQDDQMLRSFADDVTEILDRCGIETFHAKPGDPFDRERHSPVGLVDCTDATKDNTVAEVIDAGFLTRATGTVRRPLRARFYQHARFYQQDGAT